MQSTGKIIARNTFVSWLNFSIAAVSNLILTPFILRKIGTPAYGLWIIISQLCAFALILDFQPAVTKYVSAARGTHDKRQISRVLSTALLLNCSIATLILAVMSIALSIGANMRVGDLADVTARTAVATLVISTLATAILFA